MKTQSIIKSLESKGLQVQKNTQTIFDHIDNTSHEIVKYVCVNGKKKCEWYDSDDVDYITVMNANEKQDIQKDWFPGQSVHKIKTLVFLMTQ